MTTQTNILADERNTNLYGRDVDRCTIELPCGKYRITREADTGWVLTVEVERQRKSGKNVWAHLCDQAHRQRYGLAVHFAHTKVWA
jgi:hypothetical protein